MLLLTYLYRLSERQVEEFVNQNLAAKEFVGLSVDVAAPDHSTLSIKSRLLEGGGWNQFEQISDTVLLKVRETGIRLEKTEVVDSVHAVTDVDNVADRKHKEHGKPPRDPQAQLVNRNKELLLDLEKTPEYVAGLKENYKIERIFGEAKHWYGFGRCRYLVLLRNGVQAFLTALALNLKRIVQLLTGVYFGSPSRKRIAIASKVIWFWRAYRMH